MAIIIHPDGTVSTIETIHDQNGNLRPKITNSNYDDAHSWTPSNHNCAKEKYTAKQRTKKIKKHVVSGRTSQVSISVADIDSFFDKRILNRQTITSEEYEKLYRLVPSSHKGYFEKKYNEYIEYRRLGKKSAKRKRDELAEKVQASKRTSESARIKMEKTSIIAAKQKRKAEKTTNRKSEAKHISTKGNTIGDIATFSSLKSNYASSQDFDVRTSRPTRPSRAPKYAYARDRYGRVQERDSFNEEKRNEFYQAQNMQRNYDYASYDADDDHDGAYSGWK